MPIYEYECDACGHRFEQIQKFSDPLVEVCPKCGERKIRKLLSSPAIQFKGSGWYVTDYAGKGSATKESKDSKDGTVAESKDTKDSKDSKESKESKPASSEASKTPAPSGTSDKVKSAS